MFYHVRSMKHYNLSNLTMTVGHQRHVLYTDNTGTLREIRDGEGHPFISEGIAEALRGFPASEGWVIEPVADGEPEPPEEVIPVEVSAEGHITQASGTLAARLKETLAQVKHRDVILTMHDNTLREMREENDRLRAQIQELERELRDNPRDGERVVLEEEDDLPPAPMIRKGKLVPPRKGVPTELHANDASVSTLTDSLPDVPVENMADLDDIPRT